MPKRPATPAKIEPIELVPRQPLAGSQQSTLARVAIAAAPEILRVAEQLANRRAQQRKPEVVPSARAVESIQLSEVVIDFTVPFVRKITMRNATAWSVAPHVGPPLVTVEQPDKRGTRMKRVGLVGISGVAALAAGLIAHYADQRIGGRGRIIDVTGRRRD